MTAFGFVGSIRFLFYIYKNIFNIFYNLYIYAPASLNPPLPPANGHGTGVVWAGLGLVLVVVVVVVGLIVALSNSINNI